MPYALARGDIAGRHRRRGEGRRGAAARRATATPTSRRSSRSTRRRRCSARVRSPSCSPGPRSCSRSSSGKLDLDADVNQYLDFKIPPGPEGEPVTLRDLMTHTGGLRGSAQGADLRGPGAHRDARRRPEGLGAGAHLQGRHDARLLQLRHRARRLHRRARPRGSRSTTTSTRTSSAPLGMTQSSFRQPLPEALAAGMSQGYEVATGKPQGYELINLAPAGSLAATGSDMGTLHDRAPAERRVRRRADPVARRPRRRCTARRARSSRT